ncbi:uncharacterized protein LOC111015253 [Momordica charantia]|uniref:Uncharacterized protein LOC111015253 n=1 Tax=Momordica charantia TaxID=3673 RepID=A0A6J1CVT6_MOMCH|nr:uncharacterized protein LOC111015253 [Momordica charantia]
MDSSRTDDERRDMELESLKKYLFRNAMKGKWEEVVEKYCTDERAHDAKITKGGDTALHVAVSDDQEAVVEGLVKVIISSGAGEKVLEMKNDRSLTPLHIAATLGNVKMCYDIASVEPSLVNIRNDDGETPLFMAALHGNKDAFLCLHSLCAAADEACFNCRRSKDGETVLHCAIMGDFFDLAFHIIKLYKELVNSVNVYGLTPLHLLATKPSAFPSGSQLGRWKMIVYHCMFVDELKAEPNSFRRALSKRPHSPPPQKCYPHNYNTCVNFLYLLRKAIQVVIAVWTTNKKLPNNNKATDNGTDAENPAHPQPKGHDSVVIHQGTEFLPENYATCFNFVKLVSKAVLVILGQGFRGIRKIKSKKEKHVWSVQVMEELLECAWMYEYDDNGGVPVTTAAESTSKDHDEITQPYSLIHGGVAFVDHNISDSNQQHHNINNTRERKEDGINLDEDEGATKILIASNYSVGDKILKYFPMSIQDIHGNNNVVLLATDKTKEYNSRLRETPILLAAKNGVVEMVEKILQLFPVAIHDLNADGKNIVLLAVENRQPHVYQLLHKCKIIKESVFRKVDCGGNSALHLAAKLGDHKPWLIPGAALQLQWELKWYRFVKDSMPLNFFPRYNKDGKTPRVMFTDTHKELVKGGGEWLTNTSESCSLVAALIATVAFATTATVPGGNDQIKGTPLLPARVPDICDRVAGCAVLLGDVFGDVSVDLDLQVPRKGLWRESPDQASGGVVDAIRVHHDDVGFVLRWAFLRAGGKASIRRIPSVRRHLPPDFLVCHCSISSLHGSSLGYSQKGSSEKLFSRPPILEKHLPLDS